MGRAKSGPPEERGSTKWYMKITSKWRDICKVRKNPQYFTYNTVQHFKIVSNVYVVTPPRFTIKTSSIP